MLLVCVWLQKWIFLTKIVPIFLGKHVFYCFSRYFMIVSKISFEYVFWLQWRCELPHRNINDKNQLRYLSQAAYDNTETATRFKGCSNYWKGRLFQSNSGYCFCQNLVCPGTSYWAKISKKDSVVLIQNIVIKMLCVGIPQNASSVFCKNQLRYTITKSCAPRFLFTLPRKPRFLVRLVNNERFFNFLARTFLKILTSSSK